MNKKRTTFFYIILIILFSGITSGFKNVDTENPGTVTDIDGNVYHTVMIGSQVWMVENLKTTRFNDGNQIPNVKDDTQWRNLTTSGYCWYNNDSAKYANLYGALYNWYSVNTGKLAPLGWHVANDDEWDTLEKYISANPGISGTGVKAMSAKLNWSACEIEGKPGNNLSINNASGFSAYPGGSRSCFDGEFRYLGIHGSWWSSTNFGVGYAWYVTLGRDFTYLMNSYDNKRYGFSVRCVRDAQ